MKRLIYLLLLLPAPSIAQNIEKWFPFQPQEYFQSKTLDMGDWLDKPAGKHGFLQMKGKDFQFEDGTPVKFWGVNICSNSPFSPEEKVNEWVKLMTKYGINGVRFHKFTWEATDGVHSTKITDEKWRRFDYFNHTLREAGIYYSWSHIYGHRLRPADSSRVLAYEEIRDTKFPWSHLNGTTASLVNFAEDLQELNIELTVSMLNHVNPHTGLRYADDPALTFIELQNEDNIFWGAIEQTLKQTPTYRKLLCEKFSKWLHKKYGSAEELRRAWNNQGLSAGESLDDLTIYPKPNHGYFSSEYEQALKEDRAVPPHVADRAAFLFEEQNNFYAKFVEAIRKTGYKGVIVGSCWQAGSGITHFYNLYADYNAGAIDRHNYFGGGTGHSLKPGKVNNESMLSRPGSGLLSTGLQMVEDRPFQISEWMSLIPNEWVAESAPLIAIYGMGLQGWDASYAFAMDYTHFTSTIQSGHGVYNVTSPLQLALYPALAAMVYREDVKEGKPFANRNVNIADLKKGQLKFIEKTSQQYDVKSFESAVPIEALAVGPVSVSFNKPELQMKGDIAPFVDKEKTIVVSNTGQLKWHYGEKNYVVVNSAGTQGVIGFAKGETFELDDVTITPDTDFSVILFTSLDRQKGIQSSKQVLVTTISRARNTGMEYNAEMTELLETGDAPILLEPVTLKVQLKGNAKASIHILDHTGNKTGKVVQSRKGVFTLDGEQTKAIYYLIERP